MKLYHNSKCLHSSVTTAFNFGQRAKGLLGKTKIEESALWIKPCNSVHTFFMNFPIDVIFVNENLKILKICENLKPFKITNPFFKAKSAFEFYPGFLKKYSIKIGDQLHVDN